jgi:large subunit ribosomal protein L25
MQVPALPAERREGSGTKAMRKLRASGELPGVLYGKGAENVNLKLKTAAVEKLIHAAAHVVELDIAGDKQHALMRGLQRDSFGNELQHIDFLRISLDEKIKLSLPLRFLGTPKGAAHGGVLEIMHSDIHVLCPAASVPRYLEVEVTHLDVTDAVRFKEVKLPEGAELLHNPEGVVIKCAHARRAEELEAPTPAAAAAAVPGAPAAPGATPAAPGAAGASAAASVPATKVKAPGAAPAPEGKKK